MSLNSRSEKNINSFHVFPCLIWNIEDATLVLEHRPERGIRTLDDLGFGYESTRWHWNVYALLGLKKRSHWI